MSPLTTLLLVGFLFVLALCVAAWAALMLASGRGAADGARRAEPEYVPLSRPRPQAVAPERQNPKPSTRAVGQPVVPTPSREATRGRGWRPDESQAGSVEAPRSEATVKPKAQVTQRPNLDDAFDRFIDSERDRRG